MMKIPLHYFGPLLNFFCLVGIFVQNFLVKPVTPKGAVGFIYRDESDSEREGVQLWDLREMEGKTLFKK